MKFLSTLRPLLSLPVSPDLMWEISFLGVGVYLVFHPALSHPLSYGVALGGGLFLLLFRSLGDGAFGVMGRTWWFFLSFLLASSFWSLSPGVTFQSTGFLFLGTLLYLMASTLEGPAKERLLVFGISLACLAAISGLEQWGIGFRDLADHLSELPQEDLDISRAWIHNKRASGILVTPGALGALMVFFIPIGFLLFHIHSGTRKLFFGAATFLLILGLLSTKSVGACFCLTLASFVVFVGRKWTFKTVGVSKGLPLAILFLGLATLWILVRERGLQSWHLASFSMRLELWGSAWALFLQHPFFGSGSGTFDEAYRLSGMSLKTGSRFAHNILFQLLVETGLAGTLLFLGALLGFFRRLKAPTRWEGWGVLTGLLAVFLFSMLDLPFQMPELVWIFAGIAGLLELRPEKKIALPEVPIAGWQAVLLLIFLISGFFPPFRPWNLALLALGLWGGLGFFQRTLPKIPFWIFAGGLFLLLRAFQSPSAMGTVWFLEIAGVALAFALLKGALPDPKAFFWFFCLLGIAWAFRLWFFSFQFPDIKDWSIFPNPKQIGIFLLPLLFLPWMGQGKGEVVKGFRRGLKGPKVLLLLLFVAITLLRINAYGAILAAGLGIAAGAYLFIPKKWLVVFGVAVCVFIAGVLALRSTAFKELDKNTTRWDRLEIWKSAERVWSSQTIQGVGPGVFEGEYERVKGPRASGINRYLMNPVYAHNEFLDLLTAFGLAGSLWAMFLLRKCWPAKDQVAEFSAVTALSAAAFVDFCLHTPLIALQAAWLLAPSHRAKPKTSWPGGLLACGLVLGLFGSAVFAEILVKRSGKPTPTVSEWEGVKHSLDSAERLNAWDSRILMARADFFERSYLASGNPILSRMSDGTFEKAAGMERANGQLALTRAERWTNRLQVDPSLGALQKVKEGWAMAEKALPLNAFVYFEEGFFYRKLALASGKDRMGDFEKAAQCFQKASLLEPNYARAWMYLGLCLKERMMESPARWDFEKALRVHDHWKDTTRLDPLEKELISLNPKELEFLLKEAKS